MPYRIRTARIRSRLRLALYALVVTIAGGAARSQKLPAPNFTPPAVRTPSGLMASPGNGRACLEWNPNLEPNLAGYRVYRRNGAGGFERVGAQLVPEAEYVAGGLENDRPVQFAVAAVLKNGRESARSNVASVTPQAVKAPRIEEGAATVSVPGYAPARVEKAVTVTFPNGQRIVMDRGLARVRDWQTPDGLHLLVPTPYGNALDLTSLDNLGFPRPQAGDARQPTLPPQITQKEAGSLNEWVGARVADDRVTFHYRLPLTGPGMPQGSGKDYWVWTDVWETWSPLDRSLGGVRYSGLARRIELDLPSYYGRDGFSVCPNDGFGVNGSCDGALTYELRWNNPYLRETRWQKGRDTRGEGAPRETAGFHPSSNATQVAPFLFLSFPQGALLLAPQRSYYADTYCMTNYAAQGKDGIWPNYALDCSTAGKRFTVETFEYLWTSDTSVQPPQKFMDASFFYRRRLADLYGLNRTLTSLDYAWDYWGPPFDEVRGKSEAEALAILRRWGKETADLAAIAGADQVGGAAELWTSSPYTVPDSVRLDPQHPVNRAIADMVRSFHDRGLRFGYWVRPEFTKTSLANVLSERFYTPYYTYQDQFYPPAMLRIEKEGIPLVREHPEWIRKGRDGLPPMDAPYHWTPMAMPGGWYDEVVYRDLVMMKALGYDSALQDGGFACLAGVDYTGGRAVAIQPYYWRFYQDISRLGMDLNGECMIGWGNSNLPTPKPGDMKNLWAASHFMFRGNRDAEAFPWFTSEMRHRAHQLYSGCYINLDSAPGHAVVARFARDFLKKNGAPDRVFLEGLRWDAGKGEWVWDRVWWEYADGRRVRYPDYAEVVRTP